MPHRRFRAVQFDLDGTLLDTFPLIYASYQHVGRAVLGRSLTDDEIQSCMGLTLMEGMQRLSRDLAAEMVQVYRRFNVAHHAEYVKAFPGARELLLGLRSAGLRVGVVTSKRKDVARLGLEICRLLDLLDVCVGEDDCAEHKPAPEPIWLGCRLLSVKAEESIYVGDSPFDMQSAARAGALPVAVAWTTFPREQMRQAGAKHFVDTLSAILDMKELARDGETLSMETCDQGRCSPR